MVARAFLSSSLLLWSRSSISCSFCEISVRMIAWYCLPCPRASMSARNSFLSWISFTTGKGKGRQCTGQRGPSGSQEGWQGRQVAFLGNRKQFCGCPSGIPPSTHTPLSSVTGPSGAHVLQTGPAQGLGSPVAQEGAFFSVPLAPSRWQKYFGVFASPSPDLLLGPDMA